MRVTASMGDPEHGWMRLTLGAGDAVLDEQVSYTPRDSYTDLLRAVANVRDGNADVTVTFNAEPTRIDIRLRRSGGEVTLEVTRFADARATSRRDRILVATGTFDDIVRPLWLALHGVYERLGADKLARRWRHPIATREIEQVAAAMR